MRPANTSLMLVLVITACATPAQKIYAPGRDDIGRIARSRTAVTAFKWQYLSCPSTNKPKGAYPSYVVDHIHSLCTCGPDGPNNMRWQSVVGAMVKIGGSERYAGSKALNQRLSWGRCGQRAR